MTVECPVCETPNPPAETYCIDCGFLLSEEPVTEVEEQMPVSYGKVVATDNSREFVVKAGETTVGRDMADILLSHGTVSRKHASIFAGPDGIFLMDAGSTNGTLLNGEKIAPEEKHELEDGAEISFGSVVFKFEMAEELPEASVADATAEAQTDAENDELTNLQDEESVKEETSFSVVLKHKETGEELVAGEGNSTVGRRPDNDIVIPDPYCSGSHAKISVSMDDILLTDLGSTNGTMVNGVSVEEGQNTHISAGDEVVFGQTAYIVTLPERNEAASDE